MNGMTFEQRIEIRTAAERWAAAEFQAGAQGSVELGQVAHEAQAAFYELLRQVELEGRS
jgi:hypothetical protein